MRLMSGTALPSVLSVCNAETMAGAMALTSLTHQQKLVLWFHEFEGQSIRQ